ncbi:hypothetical protein [Rhizobium sp. FKL33]|uniref:hypothetical protein n=1 Tax=Rhizobium sp. FKL33 TaxID=2562307 RepID=UPI0010C155EE|nr:hypothetical protein [Rhizobium sp. FKL33]
MEENLDVKKEKLWKLIGAVFSASCKEIDRDIFDVQYGKSEASIATQKYYSEMDKIEFARRFANASIQGLLLRIASAFEESEEFTICSGKSNGHFMDVLADEDDLRFRLLDALEAEGEQYDELGRQVNFIAEELGLGSVKK